MEGCCFVVACAMAMSPGSIKKKKTIPLINHKLQSALNSG